MVMTRTGTTNAKMNTQIFVTVSQYQSGSGNFRVQTILPVERVDEGYEFNSSCCAEKILFREKTMIA